MSFEDAQHQASMDQISLRVAAAVEGENMLDVAAVLAGMAAFCIAEAPGTDSEKQIRLEMLVKFIRSHA
jgi:hypothetical protein